MTSLKMQEDFHRFRCQLRIGKDESLVQLKYSYPRHTMGLVYSERNSLRYGRFVSNIYICRQGEPYPHFSVLRVLFHWF